ncbi:MAG: endo-1,4-beta-xylanase [Candidatus Sumerlaeota bacterium]|nr:endo-1,4-beta-xylanase [Candidatus Sumerlaeota bacterium]
MPPSVTPLKTAFQDQFLIGAALGGMLPGAYKPEELILIRTHFNAVTPENCMKPQSIQPSEGVFRFEQADALVAFAQGANMKVTAHCLVWHSQCPEWMFLDGGKQADRELVLKRMKTHIQAVAGRYKGKIFSWDVVNEAIDDGKGYLRDSKWKKTIGEDFIEKAFEFAREADPNAELYYNDYAIENPAKRQKTLQLIKALKSKGLKVDGVGIQGHWQLDRIPLKNIEDSILEFSKLGVKVMITELDVDVLGRKREGADVSQTEAGGKGGDSGPRVCPPKTLADQASQYGDLFRLLRKHADKISRVTFWGLNDGRSWLNNWPTKGRTNHALLFDRQCQPKPAFFAVIEAGQSK